MTEYEKAIADLRAAEHELGEALKTTWPYRSIVWIVETLNDWLLTTAVLVAKLFHIGPR